MGWQERSLVVVSSVLVIATEANGAEYFHATKSQPLVSRQITLSTLWLCLVLVCILIFVAIMAKRLGKSYKRMDKDYARRKLQTSNAVINDIYINMNSWATRMSASTATITEPVATRGTAKRPQNFEQGGTGALSPTRSSPSQVLPEDAASSSSAGSRPASGPRISVPKIKAPSSSSKHSSHTDKDNKSLLKMARKDPSNTNNASTNEVTL